MQHNRMLDLLIEMYYRIISIMGLDGLLIILVCICIMFAFFGLFELVGWVDQLLANLEVELAWLL